MNEFEKKFDDNELNDMRQQMATLKKKLQQQEIVNDRFIRHSLRRNTSSITRRYVLVGLLSVFTIPYSYWAFVRLNGSSIGVWITVCILLLIALGYTVYTGRFLYDRKLYKSNLVEARRIVAKAKKLDADWLKFGIPAVILWLGYFLYDSYGHMERDEFEIFAVAMSVAVILGGIIGLKIHFRNQSDYEDIIEQIEEITE